MLSLNLSDNERRHALAEVHDVKRALLRSWGAIATLTKTDLGVKRLIAGTVNVIFSPNEPLTPHTRNVTRQLNTGHTIV